VTITSFWNGRWLWQVGYIAGVISSDGVGTSFPLIKCLRTLYWRHCKPYRPTILKFSGGHTPGAWTPAQKRPGAQTQTPISAWLASVSIIPVLRNNHWRNNYRVLVFERLSIRRISEPDVPCWERIECCGRVWGKTRGRTFRGRWDTRKKIRRPHSRECSIRSTEFRCRTTRAQKLSGSPWLLRRQISPARLYTQKNNINSPKKLQLKATFYSVRGYRGAWRRTEKRKMS